MSSAASKPVKLGLILLTVFFVASASAAQLGVEDGQVWQSQLDNEDEITYTCEKGTSAELSVGEQFLVSNETAENNTVEGAVTTDELVSFQTGDTQALLKCYNGTEVASNDSAEISVRNLEVDATEGEGFIDRVMGKDAFTKPVELELAAENADIGSLTASDFSVNRGDVSVNDIVAEDSGTEKSVELYLRIDPGFPVQKDSVSLGINLAGERFREDIPVLVHDWRVEKVGQSNPGPKLDYSNLDKYSYNLDISNHENPPQSDTSLDNDDFKLTIEEKTQSGYDVYEDSGGTEYKDLEWLKWESPEGGPGNYKVSLDNIPDLPAGKYRFDMELSYGEGSGQTFMIDQLKVDRSMKFSGKVKDSTGSGVRTEMVLTTEDGRTVPVNAGSDGIYSADISSETFQSMQVDFFDREKSSADTNLVLDNVDLGRDADLGSGSEALGYQYWNNPAVEVEGLRAVNMMAVKFAYQINGGAETSMKFSPQSVNPRKVKVFECNDWNFIGTRCMGEWNQMNEDKISVNLATNSVNVEALNLHELPSGVTGSSAKKMLMNAYVVGVNEEMELSGTLSFSGPEDGRVPTGTDVEASGTIVSGSGTPVEDADVEIDVGEQTLEGTTDEGGSFTATGTVPEDAGNYTLELDVSHDTFQDFSTELSNDLEVYVKEEVSIQLPSSISASGFEIQEGAERGFEFDIKNTGQTNIESVQLTTDSEMPEQFVKLSKEEIGALEAGDSETVELTVELSQDYCDGICTNYPTIDVKATAESGTGKQLSDSSRVQTQVAAAATNSENQESEESETTDEPNDSSSQNEGMNIETPEVVETTGEFLASQSSVNIVLALIMLFTMILAGAVKKGKDGDSDRRMRGGGNRRNGGTSRPSVQKPDLSGGSEEDDEVDSKIEEMADRMKDDEVKELAESVKENKEVEGEEEEEEPVEKSSEEEQESENKCSVCGEEFDTETARKLHEQAIHD